MTPEEISRWSVAIADTAIALAVIVASVAFSIWVIRKLVTERDRG